MAVLKWVTSCVHRAKPAATGLARVAARLALICAVYAPSFVATSTPCAAQTEWTDGFDYPVGKPNGAGWRVDQDFGENSHLGEDWNKGSGDDDLGEPVSSASNGKVVVSSNFGGPNGWGNVVIIQHQTPDGTRSTMYAHLNERSVSVGAVVSRGQQIGTVGKTGGPWGSWNSSHLHFELRLSASTATGSGYGSPTQGQTDPSDYIDAHRPPWGDSTPPVVHFSHPNPTNRWYRSNERIDWSITDNSSGVKGFGQSWTGCPPLQFYTSAGYLELAWAGEGLWRAHVQAWDNRDNHACYEVGPFGYDVTPPTITPTGGNPRYWYRSEAYATWSSWDGLCGVRWQGYRWDDGAWTPGDQAAIPEGKHTLTVRAEDNTWSGGTPSGNPTEANLGEFWKDSVPPQVTLTPAETADWFGTAQDIAWDVSDATSGPDVVEVWWNDEVPHTPVATSGTVPMRVGENTLHIRATDVAGNSTQIDRTYRLDMTPPSVDPPTFSTASPFNGASLDVFVSGSDPGGSGISRIVVLVDGVEIGSAASGEFVSWDTSASSEGSHSITAVAYDRAGHSSASDPTSYVLDRTPPSTAPTVEGNPGLDGWYVGPVQVTLDADDGLSPVRAIWFRLDGGDPSEYTSPLMINTDGEHRIRFYAADATNPSPGNLETPQELAVKVNVTTPSMPAVLDEGSVTDDTCSLSATWQSEDALHGLHSFRYAITDTPTAPDADLAWVLQPLTGDVTGYYWRMDSLRLIPGTTYFIRVQTRNKAGLWSASGQSDGITVSGTPLPNRLRYGMFASAGATEDSGPLPGVLGEATVATLDGNANGLPGDLLTQPDGLGYLWAGFMQTQATTWAEAILLKPPSVVGGESVGIQVTLAEAAPPGGVWVELTYSDPSAFVSPPAGIHVPEGQTTASVDVATVPRVAGTVVEIAATYVRTATAALAIRAFPTTTYTINREGVIGETVDLRAYLYRPPGHTWLPDKHITFAVDGSPVGGATTEATGRATLPYTIAVTPGSHGLTATFAGDVDHAGSTGSAYLEAYRLATKLYGLDRSGRIATSTVLRGYLYRLDSTGVRNKTLVFAVAGTAVGSAVTGTTGRADLPYRIADGDGAGDRQIEVTWPGDAGYMPSQALNTLRVTRAQPYIWVLSKSVRQGQSAGLYAYFRRLPDYAKQPGKQVTFRVDGTAVGTVATDQDGIARYQYLATEPPGRHTIRCEFAEDAWVEAGYGEGVLTIL